MTTGPRTAAARESMLVVTNLALVVLVLLPVYVLAAAVIDLVLGVGSGSIVERVAHHARDRWWVPLLYLLCAPFVMFLLRSIVRSRPDARLRLIALVSASVAYAALFLFFFAGGAPDRGALARALAPGVIAVLVYAAVMRLPGGAMVMAADVRRAGR